MLAKSALGKNHAQTLVALFAFKNLNEAPVVERWLASLDEERASRARIAMAWAPVCALVLGVAGLFAFLAYGSFHLQSLAGASPGPDAIFAATILLGALSMLLGVVAAIQLGIRISWLTGSSKARPQSVEQSLLAF